VLKENQLKSDMQFDEFDLIASITRQSFYDFVQEFWGTVVPEEPVWNWHIKYLCEELQIVAERVFAKQPKEYDLVINVPPGTTKSTIFSVLAPAWIWTRMPSARIIGASYTKDLALDLGLKNRDVVLSELYVKCFSKKYSKRVRKDVVWVNTRMDQFAKSNFATTRGGARFSTGVGGTITGKHGHFIFIDDPLNPGEAISEVELKSANRWMNETIPTRMVDKKVTPIILIMQRLHQNDPTANMIEKASRGGTPIKHICLPAELSDKVRPQSAERYYVDGLLDTVRLPQSVLQVTRVSLGPFGYAGQFEQHPVPLGGGLFKWERINVELPPPTIKYKRVVRYWDKAATQDGGCFTVGTKMGRDTNDRYWILNVIRGQWSSDKRESIIKSTAEMDGHDVEIGLEQEPGSGGKDSVLATVKMLAGYRVAVDKPTGSKELRADPFSIQVNIGNVYMVPAAWNVDYLSELEYFPHSKYKDQVDTSSGAFNLLTKARRRAGGLW